MKRSVGESLSDAAVHSMLGAFSFLALYPFLYVLAASLSDPDFVARGKILFFPQGFGLAAYGKVMEIPGFFRAYANTAVYTAAGTVLSLGLTILGAYPLSRKRLRGGGAVMLFAALTMWFKPGMIPTYLNLRDLHFLDSRLGYILAFSCQVFYMIILRTYFQSIPDSMEESAKIDGADDFRVLGRIMLPLATPAVVTIGLYYAVEKWNAFFWAMILFKTEAKVPLQVLLRKLIVEVSNYETMMEYIDHSASVSIETVIFATIIVSILPVVAVYPLIQRFFIKGMMVGSIKG